MFPLEVTTNRDFPKTRASPAVLGLVLCLNVPVRTSDDKRHFPIDFGKTSRAGEDVLRKSEINSGGIEVVLKQPEARP